MALARSRPVREIAILFAGIFVATAPVMAMLQAGKGGAFVFPPASHHRA